MIVALGRINLAASVESTDVECLKCKAGDLVFLTPLAGDAAEAQTSVEAYDGHFLIGHQAVGGNSSFGYMVVRWP